MPDMGIAPPPGRIRKVGSRSVKAAPQKFCEAFSCGCPEHASIHGLFQEEVEVNYAENAGFETIEMVIDSGAAESVAPASTAPWIQAIPSEGSKKRQKYLSASGERLPNLGEKRIHGHTNENWAVNSTFQIAEVTRPLCSVSQICDRGNEVHFTSQGGFIVNQQGRRTHFKRDNNVYVMQLHAKTGQASPGFPRPS